MFTQRDQIIVLQQQVNYLEDRVERERDLRQENLMLKQKIDRLERQVKHLISELEDL